MAIFRDLKVHLTDDEWGANAAALAQLQADLKAAEAEKKESASGYKARIDALKSKADAIGDRVRTREETRAVECFERPDNRRFVVELFRADNHTLVETRPMTANERHAALQPMLPGTAAPAKKKANGEKPRTVEEKVVDAIDQRAAAGEGEPASTPAATVGEPGVTATIGEAVERRRKTEAEIAAAKEKRHAELRDAHQAEMDAAAAPTPTPGTPPNCTRCGHSFAAHEDGPCKSAGCRCQGHLYEVAPAAPPAAEAPAAAPDPDDPLAEFPDAPAPEAEAPKATRKGKRAKS
jgi:hypothetical protein